MAHMVHAGSSCALGSAYFLNHFDGNTDFGLDSFAGLCGLGGVLTIRRSKSSSRGLVIVHYAS